MGQKNDISGEAAFAANKRGDVCIAVDDPAFVQADMIVVDEDSATVHALLHQTSFILGKVSQKMLAIFDHCNETLVASLRADGSIYEMMVPVKVIQKKGR